MESVKFICVLSGYEPKRKTTHVEQQRQYVEAKRREINFGTHHRISDNNG